MSNGTENRALMIGGLVLGGVATAGVIGIAAVLVSGRREFELLERNVARRLGEKSDGLKRLESRVALLDERVRRDNEASREEVRRVDSVFNREIDRLRALEKRLFDPVVGNVALLEVKMDLLERETGIDWAAAAMRAETERAELAETEQTEGEAEQAEPANVG